MSASHAMLGAWCAIARADLLGTHSHSPLTARIRCRQQCTVLSDAIHCGADWRSNCTCKLGKAPRHLGCCLPHTGERKSESRGFTGFTHCWHLPEKQVGEIADLATQTRQGTIACPTRTARPHRYTPRIGKGRALTNTCAVKDATFSAACAAAMDGGVAGGLSGGECTRALECMEPEVTDHHRQLRPSQPARTWLEPQLPSGALLLQMAP